MGYNKKIGNFEKEKRTAIHIFYHFIVEQYYQYYV